MSLLEECIAAHGGSEAFERLDALRLRVRCGGLAMAMKLRARALSDVQARVDLRDPAVRFDGLGEWRAATPRPARMPWRFPWRDEDVTYFAGYALWNYLAAPFIWSRCETQELAGRRIAIEFPDTVPTHSRRQVAHLDMRGRVARLDYTADVFGPWARAQNVCLRYEGLAGVLFCVRRRVTPRGLAIGPTLVSIALDELSEDTSASDSDR